MERRYEVEHRFSSDTDEERSENLYKILLEYRRHQQRLKQLIEQEGIEHGDSSPLH